MPSDHGWTLLHRSRDGQYYFTVEAENDQVLVTSETYTSKQAALNGLDALKRVIKDPKLLDVDTTK